MIETLQKRPATWSMLALSGVVARGLALVPILSAAVLPRLVGALVPIPLL